MEARDAGINDIFDRNTNLKIPYFQRSYVWEKDLWERFLNDLTNSSKYDYNVFMGAIITKSKEESIYSKRDYSKEVIDGQQRLTTLALFFKALCEINKNPNKFNENFKTHEGDLILKHNHIDKKLFEKILLEKDISESEKKEKIYKCYEYFKKELPKRDIDPNKVLAKVLFVLIRVSPQEDEQEIFDTINTLGVSLTTADLLKNFLFRESVEDYENKWKPIFENIDKKDYWEQKITSGRMSRKNIDLFLEAYLSIKIHSKDVKISSEEKSKLLKINSVFKSYKELIRKKLVDKDTIIKEIKDYSNYYKNIIYPKILFEDIEKHEYLKRLNIIIFNLNTTTIIPYLLYISKNSEEEEKEKIYKFLESYLMRRIITKKSNKNYNNLFRSLIRSEINTFEKLKSFIDKRIDNVNVFPGDSELREGIKNFEISNKKAVTALYLIEKSIRDEGLHSTSLRYIKGYSLEHVMPKNWRKNWDSKNLSPLDREKRDKKVSTLGNLTLITKKLNSSIRDASWKTKKEGKNDKKGLNEYSIGTIRNYLDREEWNEETIEKRADEIYKHIIENVWEKP